MWGEQLMLCTVACCPTAASCTHCAPATAAPPALFPSPSRDPAVTLVGFGWDGGDERQMQRSFGWGRSQFGGFLDLQSLAESLGYYQLGLWGLAAAVLGLAITKNKQVRRRGGGVEEWLSTW